jgi:hypothetical protein
MLGGENRNSLVGEKTIPGPLHVSQILHGLHGFDPESVHVGFVVDKMALGQVFIQVRGASLLCHCACPSYSLIHVPPTLYKLGD